MIFNLRFGFVATTALALSLSACGSKESEEVSHEEVLAAEAFALDDDGVTPAPVVDGGPYLNCADPSTFCSGQVTVRTPKLNYFSAKDGGVIDGPMSAAKKEFFRINDSTNGFVTLQSWEEKYLSVATGTVLVNATTVTASEVFKLVDLGNRYVAFQTQTGKFLSAVNGGGSKGLHANATAITANEIFNLNYVAPPAPVANRVLLMGDSITQAYFVPTKILFGRHGYSTEFGGYGGTGLMNPGFDWVDVMEEKIQTFMPSQIVMEGVGNYQIFNDGYTAIGPEFAPFPFKTIASKNADFFNEWQRRAIAMDAAARRAGAEIYWATVHKFKNSDMGAISNEYLKIPNTNVVDIRAALGGDTYVDKIPTPCFWSDTFTRPDSAGNLGNFEVGGGAWQDVTGKGDFGIMANRAGLNMDMGAVNLAISPKLPSTDYTINVALYNATPNNGIVFRYADASNYWRLKMGAAKAHWELLRVSSGVSTLMGQTAPGTGFNTLKIVAVDRRIQIYGPTGAVLLDVTAPTNPFNDSVNFGSHVGLALANANTKLDAIDVTCPATTSTRSWDGVHLYSLGDRIVSELILKTLTGYDPPQ